MSRTLDFAKRLIAAPSVTPARGPVFDAMEAMLAPLGFDVHRFIAGEGEDGGEDAPVENLFAIRSEEHTSELQSLMRISYAVFCLQKKIQATIKNYTNKH